MTRTQGFELTPYKRKSETITRSQFGYEAARTLKATCSTVRKVGGICRLARMYRHLRQSAVATTAGCAPSHVCRLEGGEVASLESYISFIIIVRVDGPALFRFVFDQLKPPDAKGAELLLLDDLAAVSPSTLNETIAALSAPTAHAQLVFADAVQAVIQQPWSKTKKIGEICKLTRKLRNLSQQSVANRARYSTMRVSRLESGDGNVSAYAQLARALDLDAEKLDGLVDGGGLSEEISEVFTLKRTETEERDPRNSG